MIYHCATEHRFMHRNFHNRGVPEQGAPRYHQPHPLGEKGYLTRNSSSDWGEGTIFTSTCV